MSGKTTATSPLDDRFEICSQYQPDQFIRYNEY